jgi:hypothetical protein
MTMSTTTHANNCAPSLDQLRKFVNIRNRSEFSSNLQFAFDANEAGFDVEALGTAEKVGYKHAPLYRWQVGHGLMLQEWGGKLGLYDAKTGEQVYPTTITVPMLEPWGARRLTEHGEGFGSPHLRGAKQSPTTHHGAPDAE